MGLAAAHADLPEHRGRWRHHRRVQAGDRRRQVHDGFHRDAAGRQRLPQQRRVRRGAGARRNAVHEWALARQGRQRERDHAVSGVLPGRRRARLAIGHLIVPRAPQRWRKGRRIRAASNDALTEAGTVRPADSRRGNLAARGQSMIEKRFWSGAIAVVTLIVAGAGALPELLLRPASTGPSVALPAQCAKGRTDRPARADSGRDARRVRAGRQSR